jgi:hypothetical protein
VKGNVKPPSKRFQWYRPPVPLEIRNQGWAIDMRRRKPTNLFIDGAPVWGERPPIEITKHMPPRSFAIRLTQTTKLFDFLINISRSVTVRAAPFLRTSFAATRCCSARNCISVSTTLVFAEAEAGLCQNSSRLILDVFKLPFACNISSTVCPIIV